MKLNHILVIEDSENDLELTLDALTENNFANKIEVARDGAEALDYVFREGRWKERQTGNPTVILLDLKLPKISGLEVLKKLREDETTKNIPVVILTSSKEEQDIYEGYRLGTNAYVVKPVEFDEFVKAIRSLGVFWALVNQPPHYEK